MIIIGSVSIDIHKRERDFKDITLSDINAVKWLILYRDKIDIYFENKTDNFFKHAGNVQEVNQELVSLYVSLDELVGKCHFNKKQLKLIELLQKGYTYDGIGELNDEGFMVHGLNPRNSKSMFETICKRIIEQNNYDWSITIHDNYLTTRFKRCTRCEELLPGTLKFYGSDLRNKDGMQSFCRKCDGYRKKHI